ncbi:MULTISPECIES: alpha/beta hydrolase fold domain-containing protein [Actinotignum]|uniref:alpha/beta hydrolase fold domain-containing protein n=1 Tax=Actinotignum TaxID=1653174 RepID=UPI00254C8EF0|nr:alpha/beta hydrolase fold domain-containing protein [Actinotignum schaalii]MDE1536360.1 alpha/beta hydrolase fold domain-containing protein [Actinotignum schaalii]MDK7271806.1 alpha/beta hydrolase fold domain-containing protein [Actinotignum schaalii]
MSSSDVRLSASMRAALAQDARLALPHHGHGEPAAMQARYEAEHRWWNEGGPEVAWRADTLPTRHGPVPVRIYSPQRDARPTGCGSLSPVGPGSLSPTELGTTTQLPAGATRPIIVYLHGGSYCVGSPATHDRLTRELAAATGAVVVSVDYTLAPGARYPRISEECEDAVIELARRFPNCPIVLAGDSCGATLSLGTWWRLARRPVAKRIVALVLYYGEYGLPAPAVASAAAAACESLGKPAFNTDATSDIYTADGGDTSDGMSPADRAYYDSLYFSSPAERDTAPDTALLRTELRGCPPVFLAVGECDPLLADSQALATHLEASGVRVRLEVIPGVMHAFLQRVRLLPEAARVIADTAVFLAEVLGHPGASHCGVNSDSGGTSDLGHPGGRTLSNR